MADRLFLVPQIGESDDPTETAPKYYDTPGITGWSGVMDTLRGKDVYLVRYYGDEATLDQIEAQEDAHTPAEYGWTEQDVADFLNQKKGLAKQFSDLMEILRVG